MSQKLPRGALCESRFARGCENDGQGQTGHGPARSPVSQNYSFLRTRSVTTSPRISRFRLGQREDACRNPARTLVSGSAGSAVERASPHGRDQQAAVVSIRMPVTVEADENWMVPLGGMHL